MQNCQDADPERRSAPSLIRLDRIVVLAGIALACAIQIQLDLKLGGSAVRVSAADIVVLALAPLAGLLLVRGFDRLRRAIGAGLLILLLLASLVMTYGLVIGVDALGSLQAWPLVKYAGWYSLICYALLGVVLAAVRPDRVPITFILAYVAGLSLTIIVYVCITSFGLYWSNAYGPRLIGFIGNPNAFGLAALCGVALWLACGEALRARFGTVGWELVIGLLSAGILFSRSIGTSLGLVTILAVFLVMRHWRFVSLLRVALVAAAFYGLPSAVNKTLEHLLPEELSQKVLSQAQDIGILGKLRLRPDDNSFGLKPRLETTIRAFNLWTEHPVLGAGLGTFLEGERARQTEKTLAQQVHNTPLWLLSEVGLVGFAVFAALLLGVVRLIYRSMRRLEPTHPAGADFLFAGLLVMAGWLAMSMAHELLYQRVVWLILGLCIGVAAACAPSGRQGRALASR